MMFYISLAAFAGVVVFGLLFIIMGLQGGPWKLPGIGMAVCFVLLVVSAVLPRLGVGGEKPGTADQPSQAVESEAVESEGQKIETPEVTETEGQKEEESTAPDDGTYTVGDAVSMNDIVVTLVNVSESEGTKFAKPDDGKIFILCEFTIENNSKNDIAVSSLLCFEAYVDDYTTGMNLSAIMSGDKPQLDGSVASGKKMNGIIGYSADKGWNSIEVRFKPDFWSGNEFLFTYTK